MTKSELNDLTEKDYGALACPSPEMRMIYASPCAAPVPIELCGVKSAIPSTIEDIINVITEYDKDNVRPLHEQYNAIKQCIDQLALSQAQACCAPAPVPQACAPQSCSPQVCPPQCCTQIFPPQILTTPASCGCRASYCESCPNNLHNIPSTEQVARFNNIPTTAQIANFAYIPTPGQYYALSNLCTVPSANISALASIPACVLNNLSSLNSSALCNLTSLDVPKLKEEIRCNLAEQQQQIQNTNSAVKGLQSSLMALTSQENVSQEEFEEFKSTLSSPNTGISEDDFNDFKSQTLQTLESINAVSQDDFESLKTQVSCNQALIDVLSRYIKQDCSCSSAMISSPCATVPAPRISTSPTDSCWSKTYYI